MYSVYIHLFPNGKTYIGLTSRKAKVRWGYGNNYHNCTAVDRAIKKYGWNNICHAVLYEVETKEEAELIEKILIKLLNSNNKEFGYNIMSGGNASGKLPEESKRKIGEKNKEKWNDPQKRAEASERMKKRMSNPEYRKKVVSALLNSERSGKPKKCVVQMDMNGNVVKIWDGLIDVEKSGIATRKAISLCCLGKLKTVKGFMWQFEVKS